MLFALRSLNALNISRASLTVYSLINTSEALMFFQRGLYLQGFPLKFLMEGGPYKYSVPKLVPVEDGGEF